MRFRLSGFTIGLGLCVLLEAGCSGGGSSASNASIGALPAGSRSSGRAHVAGARRDISVPSCSGAGSFSFTGGTDGQTAAAYASSVLGGEVGTVCDEASSIGGGVFDQISSGANSAVAAFIGAGESNVITGKASNAFIGAGNGNTATGPEAFIGAGSSNTLSGVSGFIGAGLKNTVSGSYGFLGGGELNRVTQSFGTVVGGDANLAAGAYATVPGGADNTALGELSFAAGHNSDAAAAGTFVWSDFASGATQLKATTANQFLARASGGFTLWTNAANTIGAKLNAGSGTWASASDRTLKTDVAPIDDARVLDKVAALPVSEWSYKTEPGVRHVGPMAQDFYAAFGVGEDNRHITAIDEDGVALSAIKALRRQVADLKAQVSDVEALQAQVSELKAQMIAMRSRR
jgi:hypothetical protein